MKLRIVFFGTPDFAVPSLRALVDGADEVVGVVCQADRPAGRGQKVRQPLVKVFAAAKGIPVTQPRAVRGDAFREQLAEWKPDLVVVAAYGRILPLHILELPRHGCINVHASLLPKYRGAAPIQWAIARGETETGITIMRMSEEMDAGDILLQRRLAIGPDETGGELHDRLADLGAAALREALERRRRGELRATPQDQAQVTFAPMIKKEDGAIDWSQPAEQIARRVRAFNPWPSAYTHHGGRLLKIHRARPLPHTADTVPGRVAQAGATLHVETGDGLLDILEVQWEGRRRLAAADFGRAGSLSTGDGLGDHAK
jgi:methionyl-tRNA formyltransferase